MRWDVFANSIKNVEVKWVLLMALALFTSMFFRSIRWQVIAALPLKDTGKVWQASCAGYFGSAIYPAKAGELFKIIRLQQLTGLGRSEAIISSLFDRVLDVIALLFLIILVSTQSNYFNLQLSIQIMVLCISLFFFTIVLYTLGAVRLDVYFSWLASKTQFGVRLHAIYQQFLTGVRLLSLQRLLWPCLTIQTIITFLDILACWLLFYAFGWKDLSFIPAVTMLVCLAAVFSLPSTPGYIGVYQVAAIFALAFFDINESKAVAYGTLFQTIAFVLAVGVGLQSQLNQFIRHRHRK
jgi:uncharacterized protein (TIRG00374 family)